MGNRSESPKKASNGGHNSNLVVKDRDYLAATLPLAVTLRFRWVNW
jgi:hypothetical protein